MTDQVQALFTPVQMADLAGSAIEPGFAYEYGVRSVWTAADLPPEAPQRWAQFLPGLIFPYTGADGRVEPQLKPDFPVVDEVTGKSTRYLFRSKSEGYQTTAWVIIKPEGGHPVMYVEGAKKALSVAQFAPPGWGVVALSSCTGGATGGIPVGELRLAKNRDVYVAMDGDYTENDQVWDAAEELFGHLSHEGPRHRLMVKLPSGRGKIDDLLAARPAGDQGRYLLSLLNTAAEERFPGSRKPRPRRKTTLDESFDPELEARLWSEKGQLDVQAAAEALMERSPMVLMREYGPVAVYRRGVYEPGDEALRKALARLLGGRYRRDYVRSVEDVLLGLLEHRIVEEMKREPWLNFHNTLLNLDTGELREHTPDIITTVQLPIDFDWDATCPKFDAWLPEQVGEDQEDVLLQTLSQMLDPRTAPEKALMLYGDPRTGKGTLTRLVENIVGIKNVSGVSLHQLSDDKYAAAQVSGKLLNSAQEVSANELRDISIFKKLTGRDVIEANPKGKAGFTFRNTALFIFACNPPLPTVNDPSNAYLSRMVPVKFRNSFNGKQDPAVEEGLMAELPGILTKLVLANARWRNPGTRAEVPEAVRREFEFNSNTVKEWFATCCERTDDVVTASSTMDLYRQYKFWAHECGKYPVSQSNFSRVLKGMEVTHGLEEKKRNTGRCWNITVNTDQGQWKTSIEE